jgi:2-polyprenyl-3-methyl-5-hydroxy-6-metoxy-1,4-benzoquinol methylase
MSYNNKQYWSTLVGQHMNLREVGWPQWTLAFNKARYKLAAEQTLVYLKKYYTQDASIKILEIGCGIGFWTAWVAQHYPNASYTGVDISAKAIQQLQQQYSQNAKIQFIQADASQVQLEMQKYDVVLCMEVLLHITDDTAWHNALNNLINSTRIGGHIFISDPFTVWQQAQLNVQTHATVRTYHQYLNVFSNNMVSVQQLQARSFLLDNNIDFETRTGAYMWHIFFKLWHKLLSVQSEPLGKVLGYIAYQFDKWYTLRNKIGHGCRLMVCQRLGYI